METLPPGSFSCPYHLHHHEEELFIAFKGSAMVRQDNEFFEIKEGDLIFLKQVLLINFIITLKHLFYFWPSQTKSRMKYVNTLTLIKNGIASRKSFFKMALR
jgi:gentisate 1,2-dioxygenase